METEVLRPRKHALESHALDQLFLKARTYYAWQDRKIPRETLHELYDLLKMGPTSANCCPARFVFIESEEAKEKLIPCLDDGNVKKVRAAPVTIIVAMDDQYYDKMPELAPHNPRAREMFYGKGRLTFETEFRNATLQGAYLLLAARSLGLDCGPMSGFSNTQVDEVFFEGSSWKSNFLCNIGYGDESRLFPRAPRLDFDEACKIL
ncbi:MAG: malonic semialdehyde reductase [Bdellovibrionaceae bacterium]|nr:malonic semialdehyde reductase [Pseudobdellovibrionaceae bacterium]MBX3035228.1 malonic semialdehyde reductase [Pseudobdellovibrionaceae bacterium]